MTGGSLVTEALVDAQYWANVRANWFAGVRGMREHRSTGRLREFLRAHRRAACARQCFAAQFVDTTFHLPVVED